MPDGPGRQTRDHELSALVQAGGAARRTGNGWVPPWPGDRTQRRRLSSPAEAARSLHA